MAFILAAAVIIFIWWNAALPFYHDKNTEKLVSDESKCFSPRCRSIIYDKGRDYAVLMIHGYPTCPNMYTYSAKRLDEAGFDVFAPLIPTFGADLTTVVPCACDCEETAVCSSFLCTMGAPGARCIA